MNQQLIQFDAVLQSLPTLQCPFDERMLFVSQYDGHVSFCPLCIESMVHRMNRDDIAIEVGQPHLQFFKFVHLNLDGWTIQFRKVVAPQLDV